MAAITFTFISPILSGFRPNTMLSSTLKNILSKKNIYISKTTYFERRCMLMVKMKESVMLLFLKEYFPLIFYLESFICNNDIISEQIYFFLNKHLLFR